MYNLLATDESGIVFEMLFAIDIDSSLSLKEGAESKDSSTALNDAVAQLISPSLEFTLMTSNSSNAAASSVVKAGLVDGLSPNMGSKM
jgi:hypothetical protein